MKLMKQKVLSLGIVTASLLATMVAAEMAGAQSETSTKVILTTEMVTDPATGNQSFKILNLKREADLTFTNTGLEIKYENAEGKAQTVRLFADFPPITDKAESEGEGRYNRQMNAAMESDGSRMAGFMVKATAQAINEAGGELVLRLDASRKVGFLVMDYNYSEVFLIAPGNPPVSLRDAFRNALSTQINERLAAAAYHEKQANKKPVGFMDGQSRVAWGGPKMFPGCEPLFAPVSH